MPICCKKLRTLGHIPRRDKAQQRDAERNRAEIAPRAALLVVPEYFCLGRAARGERSPVVDSMAEPAVNVGLRRVGIKLEGLRARRVG
eukprot:1256368-Prymnesium_polylepis.1